MSRTTIVTMAGRQIDFDAAAQLMDKDITDILDTQDWIDEQAYFDAYCRRHHKTFGAEFEPNKANPVW